jgi:hypothetical protein
MNPVANEIIQIKFMTSTAKNDKKCARTMEKQDL